MKTKNIITAEEIKMKSILHIYSIENMTDSVMQVFDNHVEAPNWSPDGEYLLYNSKGSLFKYYLSNGHVIKLDTGKCTSCNNDHVISYDGSFIGISSGTDENRGSKVWTIPAKGGDPVLVTPDKPSYLHGISPDGKTAAYCAERSGEFDVYIKPLGGGNEVRLTDSQGLNDGPEYSPCGKYIYFNSVRSGSMQIWRMNSDGSEQTKLTNDEYNNWFPHVSRDGGKIVFISYDQKETAPGDHPAGKNISIRLMEDGKITTLYKTDSLKNEYGGQGTINVNSWSPDSKRFAYITYINN